MGENEIRALEGKFFAAFERGDSAAIAECYAPDMRVWNNVQRHELSGAEHITMLETESFPHFSDRKFIETRTDLIADGFVRQHVATGLMGGQTVHMPMCIVCRVKDGKMIRMDEYLTRP